MRTEDFERLYAEHAERLFAFLVYRTGDRPLAEDLLADTFERAFRSRWRFDRRKSSERTWIYSIALNCLRDHARRASTERSALRRVAAGQDATVGDLDPIAERASLLQALDELSAPEREAIALRFGGDLTIPEVARALGERLTTVEGRIYRGLRKLKRRLS